MTLASGLYSGVVTHARRRPRSHRLRYRIAMLLVDLDEVEILHRRLRLFSAGRFNLFSVRLRDHGDGSAIPLKAQLEARLRASGLPTGGAVRLLTMPRILGRGFNPLSVFFCHGADGALSAVVYEVNNTFGERHAYLIAAPPAQADGSLRQACGKAFYVSPFMDMDLSYAFRIRPPAEVVETCIDVRDRAGVVMSAAFRARRSDLSDGAILRAWLTHPWMTLGALVAIHLEALKIWLKGARVRRRQPSGPYRVTVVPASVGAS